MAFDLFSTIFRSNVRYLAYSVFVALITLSWKLLLLFFRGDKVIAVASMAMDPIAAQAAHLMLYNETITKTEVQ